MSTALTVVMFLIPPVAIFAAIYAGLRSFKSGHGTSRALKVHFGTLAAVFALCLLCTMGASAATETAEAAAATVSDSAKGLGYLSAAICTGLAAIGGGIALAAGIPSAIGANAEDSKTFGKSLVFVALGETLALYGVIISFIIIASL